MFIVFSYCALLYLWLCAACAQSLSHVHLFVTPRPVARQVPPLIFPVRILEWVAISSSRGSSWPGISDYTPTLFLCCFVPSLILPPRLYLSEVYFIRLLKNQASSVAPLLYRFFFFNFCILKIFSLFFKCLFCSLKLETVNFSLL